MASMLRRRFLHQITMGSIGLAYAAHGYAGESLDEKKPYYIAAYDTESLACLKALPKIIAMHKKHAMPATFFIVGAVLEKNAADYRRLLDDPLFEVASHSYSHKMLKDNPFCGKAIPLEQIHDEIFKGKKAVESVFERPCLGFRPGCGFVDGFKHAPEVLAMLNNAGFAYTSSQLWGPDYSLPIPFNDPYTYAEDNYPNLWEIPAQGWHENLLKNNNKMGPKRITLWPPSIPEAIPNDYIKTPQEEFAINKVFIDKALKEKHPYVTFVWHPWSLDSFDPAMKMLDLTFSYIRKNQFQTSTFLNYVHTLTKENK